MADKLLTTLSYEQLKNRHIGVGDADISQKTWQTNVHRDTLSSLVGHPSLLRQYAIAYGEPQSRVRMQLVDKMADPLKKNYEGR